METVETDEGKANVVVILFELVVQVMNVVLVKAKVAMVRKSNVGLNLDPN